MLAVFAFFTNTADKFKAMRKRAKERRAKRDEKRGYHIYWGKAFRRVLSLSLHFLIRIISYIFNILITIMIIAVITAVVCGIVFAFYLKDNVDPTLDVEYLRTEQDGTTRFFIYDENGEELELEEERIHGGENRIWVPIREVPDHVIDAFVAIEDHRFWDHKGVDWYRTLGAVQNFIIPSGSTFGGSTITQQLVKNVTGDDEYSIQRKVQEIFRALYVEQKLNKKEILEYYLNTIYLSQGCYGIKTAAKTYFGKDVADLTLAEGAALASIVKYPTKYDPKQNPEYNQERRNTVLKTMYGYGKITKEEFEEAWDEPLKLYTPPKNTTDEEQSGAHVSSDYVDAVIEDLIEDIMTQKKVSREIASNLIFSSGYRVYLCMDQKVQSTLEKCYLDDSYFPNEAEYGVYKIVYPQSAMVVCDPLTGDCLGLIGRRWAKTQSRIFNGATQARRSPGSSIKPLSTYGPAIDLGLITWGTVFDDTPVTIDKDTGKVWPQNVNKNYNGLVTIRYAVEESLNTIAVKVLQKVTVNRSYEYLKKLGIKNLVESYTNSSGQTMSDLEVAPLALGATTLGLTVREMASAYTTFTNGGIHNKCRTYTKVLDSQGNVVLDNKPESTVVFSADTCTIMTKLMENIPRHYESYIKIDDMCAVAGKTGTSMFEYDRWFCGFTPYYVGAVWYGFYDNSPLHKSYRPNPAMFIFDKVMVELHKEMYEKAKEKGTELIQEFPTVGDIVEVTVCKDSGQLYNPEICGRDERGGRAEKAYYINGTQPMTYCSRHVVVKYCKETGKEATAFCPDVDEKVYVLETERDPWLGRDVDDWKYLYRPDPERICTVHTEFWHGDNTEPAETLPENQENDIIIE